MYIKKVLNPAGSTRGNVCRKCEWCGINEKNYGWGEISLEFSSTTRKTATTTAAVPSGEQMHYSKYKIACFNYPRWFARRYISGLSLFRPSLAPPSRRLRSAREESLHHNRSSGIFLRIGPPTGTTPGYLSIEMPRWQAKNLISWLARYGIVR